MDAMTISVVLLWLAVLVLGVLLWALSRQVGVLFERVAPMGALVTDAGPAVGSASPSFVLRGIQSEAVTIGGESAQPTLLFFLSPTCPVCKKLIPVLKALVRDERRRLAVVLASDGEADEHLRFMREQGLQALPYVLSTELGMSYRVSRLPYAVLLDAKGNVAAKGLVNSREQLDSLLNAHDMGTPTIQRYLESPAA
jgi:methylamine dehydrogenase accessory protein MauD